MPNRTSRRLLAIARQIAKWALNALAQECLCRLATLIFS